MRYSRCQHGIGEKLKMRVRFWVRKTQRDRFGEGRSEVWHIRRLQIEAKVMSPQSMGGLLVLPISLVSL